MPFAEQSSGVPAADRVEWINCLTGVRGSIGFFPADMLAEDGAPGVSFRRSAAGRLCVCPDFRGKSVRIDGRVALTPVELEPGDPVALQMGRRLLALCAADGADEENWAAHYRPRLWTLFESEMLDALETVRSPEEIPGALARSGLPAADCCVSPCGLPVAFPLPQVLELFR